MHSLVPEQKRRQLVQAVDQMELSLISPELCEAIKSLWQDSVIAKAYERRREFHLSDSAK